LIKIEKEKEREVDKIEQKRVIIKEIEYKKEDIKI